MAATLADVLSRARTVLNDPVDPDAGDGVHYLDAELLEYAAAAIHRIATLRPDLLFGRYVTGLPDSYVASSVFPLTIPFLQSVADYVVFRAETKDDDHVNSQRALQFMQLFDKEATT